MANIKAWLEEAVSRFGEPLEAIVVGRHDRTRWDGEASANENAILSPADGLALLDQEYDNGYGGADCRPMYAWTASRVFLIHEYDGATGPVWIPRHPMAVAPEFGGQGF